MIRTQPLYKPAYLAGCPNNWGIHYCAESLVFKDERRPRKYATKEMNAPPKLKPMLTVRKISTPRMFAQAGLLSTAKKFMTPKKVSTKKM